MRSATKTRRPSEAAELSSSMYSYPASVSPNSSAILTLTVLATREEVLAVLRTAALLARTFKRQLCVDLPEKETLVVDPDDVYDGSQLGPVDSAQIYLHQPMFASSPTFVLETNFTAATFISAGSISVRVRTGESVRRSRQS
jgi:hypothetical protein